MYQMDPNGSNSVPNCQLQVRFLRWIFWFDWTWLNSDSSPWFWVLLLEKSWNGPFIIKSTSKKILLQIDRGPSFECPHRMDGAQLDSAWARIYSCYLKWSMSFADLNTRNYHWNYHQKPAWCQFWTSTRLIQHEETCLLATLNICTLEIDGRWWQLISEIQTQLIVHVNSILSR